MAIAPEGAKLARRVAAQIVENGLVARARVYLPGEDGTFQASEDVGRWGRREPEPLRPEWVEQTRRLGRTWVTGVGYKPGEGNAVVVPVMWGGELIGVLLADGRRPLRGPRLFRDEEAAAIDQAVLRALQQEIGGSG